MGAKFMNFLFWPFLWFGLPGRLTKIDLKTDEIAQENAGKIDKHQPKFGPEDFAWRVGQHNALILGLKDLQFKWPIGPKRSPSLDSWCVPNPPCANPLVAERATWRSSQSCVTGGQQPFGNPYGFLLHTWQPLCDPMVTRGEGSFSYQGVSTRGVRQAPGQFLLFLRGCKALQVEGSQSAPDARALDGRRKGSNQTQECDGSGHLEREAGVV